MRLDHLAFATTSIALLPVLLAQGLGVRWRALRLPEPPGERSGIVGRGAPLRLLILGDSAAAGVGADSQLEALSGQLVTRLATRFQVDWRLLASTGATTASTLATLAAEPEARYDVVLSSLGVNDVTSGRRAAAFVAAQERLAELLCRRFGVSMLLLSGLPPMGDFPLLPQPLRWYLGQRAQRLDAALVTWASTRTECEHLAFGPLPAPAMMAVDGFHPGPQIYSAWAAAAAERIARRFEAPLATA